MSTALTKAPVFIQQLENLVRSKNRGALAALRRGLGKPPGATREMDRYVLRYLPSDANQKQENAYYLVGSLFAYWHQGKSNVEEGAPANIGGSLRLLVDKQAPKRASREDAEKGVEKRLIALLNCHQDDLAKHLRHIVGLLKSEDIPIGWAQLLQDIQKWQHGNRYVQRSWARNFWRDFTPKKQVDL